MSSKKKLEDAQVSLLSDEDPYSINGTDDAAHKFEPGAFTAATDDDAAAAKEARERHRSRMLIICFVLMVFIGLGNRITSVVMYTPMQRYPLFTNLLTTFAYLPTSLAYILPMARYRPDVITPEARAVPQRVWAIMGALDSLAGVMQSLAQANLYAEGALVVLLLQSAIPTSMLITKLFLKTRYTVAQYVGATAVIAGILIDLVPSLVTQGGDNAKSIGIWSAVMVLSCVPMTLSSVYKEKNLGDVEIDAIYLNYWVAFYQFLISFPLLVPSGLSNGVVPSELGTNLIGGVKCYVGINAYQGDANTTIVNGTSITTYSNGDDCSTSPLYVNLYIMFNLAYNVLIILMLKYGSSNILWLCLTLQVPIANFVFALPFMPQNKPVQLEDGIGLLVIMIGLITYRFFKPLQALVYARLGWQQPEDVSAVAADPGNEQQGDGLQLATTPQAPGATPMLGPRAHRSKVPAASKATALQAQRDRLQAGASAQGATAPRQRGGSR